jgi:hypothetical protein
MNVNKRPLHSACRHIHEDHHEVGRVTAAFDGSSPPPGNTGGGRHQRPAARPVPAPVSKVGSGFLVASAGAANHDGQMVSSRTKRNQQRE